MPSILDEILKSIPDADKNISDSGFEGANIILYTKNKDFFLNQNNTIRDIVNQIKKRIELRPDPSICMEVEKAEELVRKIIPEDAKIGDIKFDPSRSIVVIEAEKPGVAIGKQGEVLKEVKKQILWVPNITRTPPLKSKIIDNIRAVLFQESDYRRKFLNKVGHRVYDGWKREKKSDWIRLTMLGGGRQVGRSCIFLQTPESRILLDCGINIAVQDHNAYPYLDSPEFKIDELDAVVLSHAHLDHSGCLPFLYKMGYRGPVYCTSPTRDISALLALDFIGVAFKQAKKALFDIEDVKEMVKHTITLDWEEVTDITPDIRLTLYNSGHILGSSMCHLHIGNGTHHNLLYTGDFKFLRTKILEPAVTNFPRLETVIIESTYGSKDDVLSSRKDAELELIRIIKETIHNGGKVLIPVLGVGRAQEIMLIVEEAIRTGQMERFPIYVHGMVWDVTAIHTAYPDYLNNNLRRTIFHKDQNPFMSDIFFKVGSKKEQDQIMEEAGPCVIIATAGMLNAGASLDYFKRIAGDPKSAVIFVSYLGEGTIGRRVQNGEKELQMMDNDRPEMVKVNLGVHTLSALTGHAGRNELVRFIYSLNPKPKRVIVNHGESSKCLDLASSLHKMAKIETSAPKNLETIRIR
ncbi:MAG: beta-CASP ribonuclease aCPSF1 [Nanoarchaeota archaeon]|mgnify:FL=1